MIRKRLFSIVLSAAVLAFASTALMAQEAEDLLEALRALEALEDQEFMQDPRNIMTWVEVARAVEKGETVNLRVTIENARADEVFKLSSIDIAEGYLKGFKILRFAPEPRQKDRSMGTLVLEYPVDIPSGETREFEFTLRAKQTGVYIGDVDVCEGDQFLTRVAQTLVK